MNYCKLIILVLIVMKIKLFFQIKKYNSKEVVKKKIIKFKILK